MHSKDQVCWLKIENIDHHHSFVWLVNNWWWLLDCCSIQWSELFSVFRFPWGMRWEVCFFACSLARLGLELCQSFHWFCLCTYSLCCWNRKTVCVQSSAENFQRFSFLAFVFVDQIIVMGLATGTARWVNKLDTTTMSLSLSRTN